MNFLKMKLEDGSIFTRINFEVSDYSFIPQKTREESILALYLV